MAATSDQGFAVARVYASAILKLAEAQGDTEVVLDELSSFAECIEQDADLRNFASSPIVDDAARRDMIEKIFRGKCTDLFADALQVINRKGRLNLVPAISTAFRLERDALRGRTKVKVRSALPLTDESRARLTDVMSRRTGTDVDLVEEVDESLIGGLVLQIGDEKLDASVATRLKRISESLLDRASREIHSGRKYHDEASAT